METLGVIIAFGGIIVGAGMLLYATWVGTAHSVMAGWKIVGLAFLIAINCWIVGAVLMHLSE